MTVDQLRELGQALANIGINPTPSYFEKQVAAKNQFAAINPAIRNRQDLKDFYVTQFEAQESAGNMGRRKRLNPRSAQELDTLRRFGSVSNFEIIPDPNGVYPGQEVLTPLLLQALTGAPTLDPAKGYVFVLDGIQSTRTMQRGTLSMQLQRYVCEPTFSSNYAFKDFEVSVCDVEANMKMCRKELIGSILEIWTAAQNLGLGGAQQLPSELQDLVMGELLRHFKSQLEYLVWRGNPAQMNSQLSQSGFEYLNLCTGFLTRLETEMQVIRTTAVTLTSSNFFNEWGRIKSDASSSIVLENMLVEEPQNLIAYCSPKTKGIVIEALRNSTNNFMWERKEAITEATVDGVKFVTSPAIPNDTIVLSFKDARTYIEQSIGQGLWLTTDQTSNFEEIIFDRASGAENDNYVARLKTRIGTALPYPEHTLLYN